jgi:hypothetical protein
MSLKLHGTCRMRGPEPAAWTERIAARPSYKATIPKEPLTIKEA